MILQVRRICQNIAAGSLKCNLLKVSTNSQQEKSSKPNLFVICALSWPISNCLCELV